MKDLDRSVVGIIGCISTSSILFFAESDAVSGIGAFLLVITWLISVSIISTKGGKSEGRQLSGSNQAKNN